MTSLRWFKRRTELAHYAFKIISHEFLGLGTLECVKFTIKITVTHGTSMQKFTYVCFTLEMESCDSEKIVASLHVSRSKWNRINLPISLSKIDSLDFKTKVTKYNWTCPFHYRNWLTRLRNIGYEPQQVRAIHDQNYLTWHLIQQRFTSKTKVTWFSIKINSRVSKQIFIQNFLVEPRSLVLR